MLRITCSVDAAKPGSPMAVNLAAFGRHATIFIGWGLAAVIAMIVVLVLVLATIVKLLVASAG
jgi:hypothetical protein